jgi:hypothetical protein
MKFLFDDELVNEMIDIIDTKNEENNTTDNMDEKNKSDINLSDNDNQNIILNSLDTDTDVLPDLEKLETSNTELEKSKKISSKYLTISNKIVKSDKYKEDLIIKFNTMINKMYDNDKSLGIFKDLFVSHLQNINLSNSEAIDDISQQIEIIESTNNNDDTRREIAELMDIMKEYTNQSGPSEYEYEDEDAPLKEESYSLYDSDWVPIDNPTNQSNTNELEIPTEGQIDTSDTHLRKLYSQIQYSDGCACGHCRPKKVVSIDPLLSYDRRFFPAPNPANYRMSREIWAYPKYTEELSIQEFAKQFLMKKKTETKPEDTVASETDLETTSDTQLKQQNSSTDAIDEMIDELDTQIQIKKDETSIPTESLTDTVIEKETTVIMEDDELICPISFEPIEELAMTCYGQIYEKEDIENWLMEHDTDPISGRFMFTKQLITKGIDRNNIKYWQKKIRENMQILYNYPIELLYPEDKVNEVRKVKENIRNFDESFQKIWKEYSNNKLSCFRNPSITKDSLGTNKYIYYDNAVQRPLGTGSGFEYIDLSGDYFTKFQSVGQNFKLTSFNGADLSNNVFVQCQFSRSTFIGANLSATIFHGCSFLGEEVNFADASCTDETQFIDCKVEDIGDWTSWKICEKVEQCLKRRLLKGPFVVLSFDE